MDDGTDEIGDSGIGFVFDAFGDQFSIIEDRFQNFEVSIDRVMSKVDALDTGIIYTIKAYDKKLDDLSFNFDKRMTLIKKHHDMEIKSLKNRFYFVSILFLSFIVYSFI